MATKQLRRSCESQMLNYNRNNKPEVSGKEMTLSPLGGAISKVVVDASDSLTTLASDTCPNVRGNRPEIIEFTVSLVLSSSCPIEILRPSMLTLPKKSMFPSTRRSSTVSGKLPVVMTVPVTSGSEMTFCPEGSSTEN